MSGARMPVLLLAGALLVILPSAARADDVSDGARQLVDSAMADTVAALAAPAGATGERDDRLRALVDRYVDVTALGRSAVGGFWQHAEPGQRDGFLTEFRSFLLVSYVGSMARAEQLRFAPATVIEADQHRALVRTEIRAADGPPHPILITVTCADDGRQRITDVAAQGISLRAVLIADFGAFLRRNGGRFEALIDNLRAKIAAHHAD